MNSSLICPKCQGKGKIVSTHKTKCPKCHGLGSTKMIIGGGKPSGKDTCMRCKGSGQVIKESEKTCPVCKGEGTKRNHCILCNKSVFNEKELCDDCEKDPIIYQLIPPVSTQTVEFNKVYSSKIVKISDFGFFVQLAPTVEGLVRKKRFKVKEGDKLFVRLKNNKGGKLEFQRVKKPEAPNLVIKRIHDPIPLQKIRADREVGTYISVQARVENQRQIPRGPKVFTLQDDTGLIEAAAFNLDYLQEIQNGDIVEVIGEFSIHRGVEQIEISDIFVVEEAYSKVFMRKMEKHLETLSQPPAINFLINSETLEMLRPKFISIAKRLRRAILEQQPIIIRHHADCDGIISGIALEVALRDLWYQLYGYSDEDQLRHILKRTVNKPPFYDPLDAVRDLDFSLSDQDRFGDKLPIIIILDTGSSEESLFSYKLMETYGIEVMVVDHHFPDLTVQEIIQTHLNVYFAGGDYNICAGMLGVELARLISPEITNTISHLPAIAGTGDHVEGAELIQYIELAKEKDYTKDYLEDIAIAVDYQAYFLKFSPGRILLSDLLGLEGKQEKQINFVKLLATEARTHLETQLQISLEYVVEDTLPNGIRLAILDVENYASRFDYPPPGRITGSLFDHLAKKSEKNPLVTIGLGPDFAIFRSQNVKLDFPQLVRKCAKRLPHAGVEGGGYEVVGSMKFIVGARKEVTENIQELLTLIEIPN
ncbi:MAG: zinc finger domain-containing protein [Candidatus Hermodarchaeota archaeon]